MITVKIVSAEFKLSCLPFSHCVSRQLFKSESHYLQRKLNKLCFPNQSVGNIWKRLIFRKGGLRKETTKYSTLFENPRIPLEVYLHFISLLLLLLEIGPSEAAFSLPPESEKSRVYPESVSFFSLYTARFISLSNGCVFKPTSVFFSQYVHRTKSKAKDYRHVLEGIFSAEPQIEFLIKIFW